MGKTFGLMGVDWEQRVDLDRLRRERLAGISTMRGAMAPESGRAQDVAAKIRRELDRHGLAGEPLGVDVVEPEVMFALQAAGITVADGQQLMQSARVIKTQD